MSAAHMRILLREIRDVRRMSRWAVSRPATDDHFARGRAEHQGGVEPMDARPGKRDVVCSTSHATGRVAARSRPDRRG